MSRPTRGAGQSAHREYVRRRRSWHRRALTGIPVAAAVAAAVAWWIGWYTLTAPPLGIAAGIAVLAAYTTAVLRSPTHITAWRSGAEGEQATAKLLRALARRGAVVLHDLGIPRSRANIDHLVIGPRTVAAVNTKNWRARGARVTLSRDGTLWYGRYPQTKTVATAKWEARRAAEELTRSTGHPVTVVPVITVHGAPVGRTGRLLTDGVHIVEARRLPCLLRRLPGTLTADDIRRLAQAAEQALPIR